MIIMVCDRRHLVRHVLCCAEVTDTCTCSGWAVVDTREALSCQVKFCQVRSSSEVQSSSSLLVDVTSYSFL